MNLSTEYSTFKGALSWRNVREDQVETDRRRLHYEMIDNVPSTSDKH